MKLLPPPGPERRRLTLMIGALVVIGFLYYQFGTGSSLPPPPLTTGPAATSAALNQPRPGGVRPRNDAQEPQPLKFAEMESIPDEPQAGRNLFQFGVRPAPKPVYVPPPPAPPPPPPPVYTPPPIPPVPLKLNLVILDPATGKRRAFLQYDKDQTGKVFEQFEGDVIDGRYKLHSVFDASVRVSYLDGSGLRTIQVGR